MKSVCRAGCVALILGVLVFAGRSSSEPEKRPEPRTRVGLINLGYVLKYYKKVEGITKDLKAEFEREEKALNQLKEEIERATKKSEDKDLSDKERQELLEQVKKLKLEQKDALEKFKEALIKRNDKYMVIVYKNVRKAAERYAKAHDLELVLHYIDAEAEADLDNPMNVMEKMRMRACMPVYAAPGIDISKEIVAMLNKDWHEEKAPPADK